MNTDDLWNGLAGINEMMADCEDPFIEALLKDTRKGKSKGMSLTNLFASDNMDDEVHKLPPDEEPF